MSMRCPSCAAEVPAGAARCPDCGTPIGVSGDDPTLAAPRAGSVPSGAYLPEPATPVSGASAAAGPAGEGRFLPGTLVAARYRIAGVLGRGGMGEVYRADDLKLGQPVALKFLPEAAERDAEWLGRFLTEVKIARQISHPNVCRVFDVGEVDGHHFLSMEYIDGEDLASLLRRIGRLPRDKAVQIARQVCAGLAAAHDQGILHRDLKPANVMIDGRGNARLTDFGLAGLAESFTDADVRSGTPTYMAPEQLAGREVTVRSEVFSLGLVLYQLFTGRPAFEAKSLAELNRLHEQSTPAQPSRIVEDLDPVVDRIILRCLEKDPRDRPPSALAVSAALPGGDPLAAALAAGETPSPEMVAAAGEEGSLRPLPALALLATFAAATLGFVALAGRYQVTSRVPLDKPREVLLERARELLDELGSESREIASPGAGDAAWGFEYDRDYMAFLDRDDLEADRIALLRAGRPAVIRFWYRRSPRELYAWDDRFSRVDWGDPPQTASGMEAIRLDTRGRLIELIRVPPQRDVDQPAPSAEAGGGAGEVDWQRLFDAAELEMERFAPAPPEWLPPVYGDSRVAWSGELPELPGVPVRVEAAAFGGDPVYFRLIGPWSRAERQAAFEESRRVQWTDALMLGLLILALGLGLWMVRRNLRSGRGDRRGAFRLALFGFLVMSAVWLLSADHAASPGEEFGQFVQFASFALFNCLIAWILYVALEPYVRRHDPERIIGWSRLLAGRVRDPLVAREVLIGAAAGAVASLAVIASEPLERWLGQVSAVTAPPSLAGLEGARVALGRLLNGFPNAIIGGLFFVFIWFLLSRLLRWRPLAVGALTAILTLTFVGRGTVSWVQALVALTMAAIVVAALVRYGLLALIATLFFLIALANLPIARDLATWSAHGSWLTIGVLALLAFLAFRRSLGGRRLDLGSLLDG